VHRQAQMVPRGHGLSGKWDSESLLKSLHLPALWCWPDSREGDTQDCFVDVHSASRLSVLFLYQLKCY
jgi:hypothetical protein